MCQYELPQYILTDRGSNFTFAYVNDFLRVMQVKHLTTTAFRPQTNGLCERMNGTIVSVLAKLANQDQNVAEWDRYLEPALLAIRTMPNESAGYTAAKLRCGYDIRTPAIWPSLVSDYVEGEYEDALLGRIQVIDGMMREFWQTARERDEARTQVAARRYNQRVIPRALELGDLVLMRDHYVTHKLDNKWIGPLTVTRVNQHGTYRLSGAFGGCIEEAVNGDQLRPWNMRSSMRPDVQSRGQFQEQLQIFLERRDNANEQVRADV